MKKLLMLSVVALSFGAAPAFADHHEGGKRDGSKMFEKHDTNGDGAISKDEFLDHATKRFSDMDTDGDGEVTKEEARAGHEKMREKMKEYREKKAAE